MNAKVIELNRYKEIIDFSSANDDRKRIFLKMLWSSKIISRQESIKKQLLYLIWLWWKQKNTDNWLELNSIIFWMSNKEFAILRSLLDWDYSLLWYEKLSNDEQKNFILKCTEIFNEKWILTTNAYLSYCKRKIENYDLNNFWDK